MFEPLVLLNFFLLEMLTLWVVLVVSPAQRDILCEMLLRGCVFE